MATTNEKRQMVAGIANQVAFQYGGAILSPLADGRWLLSDEALNVDAEVTLTPDMTLRQAVQAIESALYAEY